MVTLLDVSAVAGHHAMPAVLLLKITSFSTLTILRLGFYIGNKFV